MNGIDYLADTNAILYILSGNECMKPFTNSRLAVSDISFMELLSFPSISVQEEDTIRRLLKRCDILHIDEAIMEVIGCNKVMNSHFLSPFGKICDALLFFLTGLPLISRYISRVPVALGLRI